MATKASFITKDLSPSFDVLDEEYTQAIKSSAINLFDSFMPKVAKADLSKFDSEKIEVRQKTLMFWPGLGKLTFGELRSKDIIINILPLNRVGASEGASGSRVFVAYFSIEGKNIDEYSNPFILKFQDVKTGDKDKLEEENTFAMSVKKHVQGNGSYFAFPIFYDKIGTVSILWALFSAAEFITGKNSSNKIEFKEDNLWKAFENLDLECKENCEPVQKINQVFDHLYTICWPLHNSNKAKKIKNRYIVNHYQSYLRKPDKWFDSTFSKLWGPKEEKRIKDFGKEWVNPLFVYEKLKGHKADLTVGSVHGDLHTKNIVFGPATSIRIIDFGWSQEKKHIAMDYILLESNLRFMILHPHVSYSDLETLCDNLEELTNDTEYKCNYTKFIHNKLTMIRESAFKFLDKDDIYNEYLIPLFLLSLGLQKFSKSFNNIISSRLTILNLATLISNKLNLEQDAA